MTVSSTAAAAREASRSNDGKFGEQARDEPDVELGEAIAADSRAAAHAAARRWGSRVDEDELAQETALELLKEHTRRGGSTDGASVSKDPAKVVGTGVERFRNQGAAANTIAQRLATRMALGVTHTRGADIAGYKVLQERLQDFHVDEGREATHGETEKLAMEVRESFPPGKRPSRHYWRSDHLQTSSLDGPAPGGAEAWTAADRVHPALKHEHLGWNDPDAGHADVEEGTAAHVATTSSDSKERLRMAYAGIAETRGSPMPVAGELSSREARQAKSAVKEAGGAVAVARQVASGRMDGPGARGLLAPFGDVRVSQARGIAESFTDYPQHADKLFGSAVLYSTRSSR